MDRCDNCLFCDICHSHNRKNCDDYSPINTDIYIDRMVEEGRDEFRQEWFKYISLYED